MALEIRPAYDDIDQVKLLFQEYTAMLGIDLSFQNYGEELSSLPGKYALPKGRLYIAVYNGCPAGCVALRPQGTHNCEMKRLYVKPEFRGLKIGRALAEQVIADARSMGYDAVVLDTQTTLENSAALYRKLGFKETEPYYHNPYPDVIYLRLDLKTVMA